MTKTLDNIKREAVSAFLVEERPNDTQEDRIRRVTIQDTIDYLQAKGLLIVWQPIETAPMCEDIDVWTQYGRYVRCQHDDYGHWYIWSDEFNQYVTLAPSTKPTHWMPLPVAPKGETK